MSWNEPNTLNEPRSDGWGGAWTEKKLDAFSKYVQAYLNIMKAQNWKTVYFDGFAGAGSREADKTNELKNELLITEQEERVYKGAAERVLSLPAPLHFDYYYFVDKKAESLAKLESMLQAKDLDSGRKLVFKEGDANKWIIELANAAKNQNLASLVFLDPFGMQIDWSSIQALKDTRSDIWILVPTGIIVNRLLERNGELKYINKLVSFFGMTEEEIRTAFYETKIQQTLFGEETVVSKVSKPIDKIARLYAQRLGGVWKYVIKEPLQLKNSNGTPIFHLVFASNNATALKIAKDIIKTV